MYLPRSLISHLYLHLLRTHHPLSPPVLLLVALDPDALCACRILTTLLKRDYIPHKIQPVSGYGDLARAGEELVQPMRTTDGGSGGVVVCLGVGGLVDLSAVLGLHLDEDGSQGHGGVEVWVIDARRPWNLGNVFGGQSAPKTLAEVDGNVRNREKGVDRGQIQRSYKPGDGGIIVFDDGDVEEELNVEREAYCTLAEMPDVEDDGLDSEGSESDDSSAAAEKRSRVSKKRKSTSDREDRSDDSGDEDERPRQRRRNSSDASRSSSPSPSPSPSKPLRHGLLSTSNQTHFANNVTGSPQSPTQNSLSSSPRRLPKPPSARTLRRRLLRMRRKHESIIRAYYSLGASYSEPISSLLYSLASELGREDNDLLWYAIVGVSSLELYGRTMTGVSISSFSESDMTSSWGGERGERIRQVLRDEVRRINPPELSDVGRDFYRTDVSGVIPTTARSPTDTSIRLSPEPRFLLIRHWSLYDSMLHSPYLSAKLHIWSDVGRKRLHKFLAKMGVSLSQCKQSYTHMDMDLKRRLRELLLKYAPLYGLDGLVPPATSVNPTRHGWGFVRSWGWKACLSATDVGVVVGAILEVGKAGVHASENGGFDRNRAEKRELVDEEGHKEGEEWVGRFWEAYDALENVEALKLALPTAMHLHRAILRTGTSLIEKRQIRHLRAFRMAIVKEGPDVQLFTHPAALTKLALWVGEAIAEQEREKRGSSGKKGTPLVLAGLNEARGVYVVVGTGGGGGLLDFAERQERKEKRAAKQKGREARKAERERKRREREEREDGEGRRNDGVEEEEDDDTEDAGDNSSDDSDDEDDVTAVRGHARNRFGNAFQEVVDETNARVRIDSFEHCVVEVKKDDLSGFLESLSMKVVVG